MTFLNPIEVLDKIIIKNNFVAVDFGCGSGGWVIPLAQRIEDGTVYALDISGSALSILKKKAKDEKIGNIKTIQADIEDGSGLSDNSCDLVLMTNLLFAVDDRKGVLKEAVRVLKDGGHLLVVDWNKESPMNLEDPVTSLDVGSMAVDFGLQVVKELPSGVYHWGLIFRK